MYSHVVEVLPAVHAFTGCDTTSKVGTKLSALQTAEKYGYELLSSFGTSDITDEMIKNAEKFLVRCIDHNSHVDTFDDLRNQIYHRHSFKLDLEGCHLRHPVFFYISNVHFYNVSCGLMHHLLNT